MASIRATLAGRRTRAPRRAAAGAGALALAVGFGVALTAPAHAAAPPATIALLPGDAAVAPGVAQTYSGQVFDATGAPVPATLTIQASEPVSGINFSSPLTISGGGVSSQKQNTPFGSGTATDQVTLATDAHGNFGFAVASSRAGSVDVSVTAGDAAGEATLTVSSGGANDAGVAALQVSPATSTQFDGAAGPDYTITATDSAGRIVSGAQVDYSVTGPDVTANGSHRIAGTTDSTGRVSLSVPNTGGAGTDKITFYVDSASQPSAVAQAVFAPVPQTTSITVTTPSDATAAPGTDQLPAGEAATVPFTATVLDGAATVAGALVEFEVTGAVDETVLATTDAGGTATLKIPMSAAGAANGSALRVTAVIGNSGQAGYRTSPTKAVVFSTPAPFLSFRPSSSVQAALGGTVSLIVGVTDQFGRPGPYAGDELSYVVNGRNSVVGTLKTGVDGTANIAYADRGTNGLYDSITVTDNTTSAANSNSYTTRTATVRFLTSTTPSSVTFPASAPYIIATVSATHTYPMSATVTNSAGDPLTFQPVAVTVSRGFVGGASVSAATGGDTYRTTTDGNGQVSFSVGSTEAGVQKIVVGVGGASATARSVTYQPGSPYDLSLTPASVALLSGATRTFVASVTDEYGNAVGSGTTLTVDGTGIGTITSGTAPYTASTATDGTVKIAVAVPSGDSSGSGTVTATLVQTPAQAADTTTAPVYTATGKYTVAPYASRTGRAATITLHSGIGVAGRTHVVSALVEDAAGTRLVGHRVAFTVAGANPVGRHLVTTNSAGIAVFRYAAHNPGTDEVTATSSPASTTQNVYVGQLPRLRASSTRHRTVVLTVQTVPRWAHVQVYVYRLTANGIRVFAGFATTNRHGVAQVSLSRLVSGGTYRFTAWVNRQSVPELYARPVTVRVI